MIYTELTKKALKITFEAHKNQTDQAGIPYVYHPYEVASHMDDEYSTCVALLHDVIEDAGITPDYLRQEGFPEEVVQAILCMTHNKELPYMDYIRIIKKNPLATKVKLADLEHNSNLSRIDNPSPKDYERVEKYKNARAILLGKDNLWNPEAWLSSFRTAAANRSRDDLHHVREIVFRNTQQIVENGGYILNGKEIRIADPPESALFEKEIRYLRPVNTPVNNRIIKVLNEDCLLTAKKLAGRNPIVLNMASRRNPGGGVEYGAGAQEECIFRSSNYYRTLYPLRSKYPMDRNFGGIYSPNVTVFRGLESEGYPLLEEPFKTNFVAVAALNRPELNPDGNYTPEEKRGMENKIRTILNIAAMFNHRVLILSAFGCGAFRNPPHHVAMLFKEILDEPAYKDRFEEVYFSIKPDHNDISDNCRAFLEVFK